VGYDDYSDIHLSGAAIAAPIWAEFMKRAIALPNYSDVKPFSPPSGVVQLSIDKATGQIATPACPDDYLMAFIEGTQPAQTCEQGTSDHRNVFQKLFGMEPKPVGPPPVSNPRATPSPPAQVSQQGVAPPPPADKGKKKGFWGRLFGGDKGDNKDKERDNRSQSGNGSGPP
jgi:penicillin-binding protein 1B